MIVAVWQFMGLTGIWAGAAYIAVNMAIAYGLSYLGGKLFGQDPREAAEDDPRGQSFAWEPHTTQKEGIPHPMCYGRNKHYGNIIAQWTDVDAISGNEVLYKLLDFGRGPVQGIVGGIITDDNKCLDGTPTFNILYDVNIDTWYQTAANINDNDKTTYVGFSGVQKDDPLRGRFESIVTFDTATINRLEYCRHWYISGNELHSGYEKVFLWYAGAYHLIATRNITTEGEDTGTIVIEAGGPWTGVTKIKIEVQIYAEELYWRSHRDAAVVHYRLYELRAWQLGDVPVFLNGQPAHNFTEANVQVRRGTLNQTCMKGFEKNKLEYKPATTIVYGEPVKWTSPNKFTDDIEYTLAFLRGLYFYNKKGKVATHSVGVKVEISERDAENWTTLMDTTISAKQLKQLYKAYRVNEQVPGTVVHGTQYDLKLSKTTEDKSPGRWGDEMQLRSIREVVDVAFTHPGRALLGVIVQGTERLQGHIDVEWITDDKLVGIYNSAGVLTAIEYSRNRAWITLSVLTQPVISGDGGANPWTIERYEGLNPSKIDIARFYEWAQWCDDLVTSGVGEETEKRMPCDIICDRQTNVWSIAYEIAQIGRFHLGDWQGNVLTGWIDKVTTESIDLITMDNVMANSWKSSYAGYGEMAGSVETFFKDAAQGYERKSRPSSNKNAGLYTRIIALEGVGVTGAALATRVGNHALKRNELIKNINSVIMGREALRYRLGRVVMIQCNIPGWGQSYRVITSPTNSTVELDRVVEDVAEDDLLWVKTFDTVNNEVSLDAYTVQSTTGKVVTIKTTWKAGCTPLKNHLAAIGIDGDIKERRIIKIEAEETNYFNVELETYDTALFPSDDTDPQLTNPDYLQPVTELALPMSRQAVLDLIAQAAAPLPKIIKPQLSNCGWSGNDVDTVTWSKLNPDEPILLLWEGKTYEITPDSTTLEYIYWDSDNPTVFQATAAAGTALAAGMYLACTNKAGVEYPLDMIQTQHGAVIQAGTITAALAQIADATIGTAKIIDLAVSTGKIAGLAVTQAKIGALAVTAAKIAALAVETGKIANLAVTQGKIGNLAVGTGQIAALAVTQAKIGNLAVGTAQIAALAVETAKIKDLAVETVKIKDVAVTTEKIAAHATSQEYGEHSDPGTPDTVSSLGTTICGPVEITTTGGDVKLSMTALYGAVTSDDDLWAYFFENGLGNLEGTSIYSVWAEVGWSAFMTYTKEFRVEGLDAGTYDFYVQAFSTSGNIVVGNRFFTLQELKK